jgi:hypothetical protein
MCAQTKTPLAGTHHHMESNEENHSEEKQKLKNKPWNQTHGIKSN